MQILNITCNTGIKKFNSAVLRRYRHLWLYGFVALYKVIYRVVSWNIDHQL